MNLNWVVLAAAFAPSNLANCQEFVSPEVRSQMTHEGRWEVVSVHSFESVYPASGSTVCFSESFLAEYSSASTIGKLDLFNVHWQESNGLLWTPLLANPSKSLGIERLDQRNIVGYCYVKVSGNHGVVLITEAKVDIKEISADLLSKTHGRIFSIFRTSKDAGKRLQHAKKFVSQLNQQSRNFLDAKRSTGGWFDELDENSISYNKSVDKTSGGVGPLPSPNKSSQNTVPMLLNRGSRKGYKAEKQGQRQRTEGRSSKR